MESYWLNHWIFGRMNSNRGLSAPYMVDYLWIQSMHNSSDHGWSVICKWC
jgi:hypothetical protein